MTKKQSFKRIVVITLLVIAYALAIRLSAQTPMPVDQAVRQGTLPNGLTYYIRHNETPKGQVDFYIAQKVGSILEEDNQRGLAHFLEHMCFNGTEHFPGNTLIPWLESKGVEFGTDLNAYTAFDETVYRISNVPTKEVGVQDTCLLILHDWADGLLLEPDEIDKERGVIHEEWRMTEGGDNQLVQRLLPSLMPNNKYPSRFPIGTMEVVDNFPHQALRDYYEKWYRPDLQGIVVVGDIDVDRIEGKIKEIFSPIKMPENPQKREYVQVPDTEGTLFAIGCDTGVSKSLVILGFKTDCMPAEMRNSVEGYVGQYVCDMIVAMLKERLGEIMLTPQSPFGLAKVEYGNFLVAKTKDCLELYAYLKDDDANASLQALYREALRAKRTGFTQGEYDRAAKDWLMQKEKAFNDQENTNNSVFANKYVDNFLKGNPMPSLEQEYKVAKMLPNMVPLQVINQAMEALVGNDNRIVLVMMPEKEGIALPSEKELAQTMSDVDNETIEAYIDNVKSEPLIPNLPAKGAILSESSNPQWGTIEMTLSNGAKVILKPTNYKNDQILLHAIAKGKGLASLPDSVASSVVSLPIFNMAYGLGDYNLNDLSKYCQGHKVTLRTKFGTYSRHLEGETKPSDLPMFMEMLYALMTEYNLTSEDFESFRNTMVSTIQHAYEAPMARYQQLCQDERYQSPKLKLINAEDMTHAKRDDIVAIMRNAFANAADFTFIFVGNVDLETMRPLIEQYVASLPANIDTRTYTYTNDPTMEVTVGECNVERTMAMVNPQIWGDIRYTAKVPANATSKYALKILSKALSQRLSAKIREDEGASYSIGADGAIYLSNVNNAHLRIYFPIKPEAKEITLKTIESEMQALAKEIKKDEMDSAKELLITDLREKMASNDFWVDALGDFEFSDIDMYNGAEEAITAISPKDVQNIAQELLSQGNKSTLLLYPE